MAEELEVLWKKLSFTEEEEDDVKLGSDSTKAAMERGKFCAVLKVLTQRSVSMEALRKNLRMMWKLKKEMLLSEVEEDLFLVEFRDEKDKKKVMDMSPWSYDKQLVIIQDLDAELTPKEMELKWSPFWVQMFNLPLKSRTRETGYEIGSKVGEVLEVDVPDSGVQWGKCLRVRIRIDVSKRLMRGKRVSIEGMEGGFEGRGAAGVRSERVNPYFTESEGVGVAGNSHVPRIEDRGDASQSWDETISSSPRIMSEKLHKEGKVNLKDGKAKDLIIQISEKASEGKAAADVKEAKHEAPEAMQWEEDTRQVIEYNFKFKSESAQKMEGHETNTGSVGKLQGPVAMTHDSNVGWTSEVLGPKSKYWKRLAREAKGKDHNDGLGPENKKRSGPTPLQELDPNIIDLKKRKGANQRKVVAEKVKEMDGGEAEAATQPRRAQ
nr:hypothetical protein CFP56_30519 [Quercus suber]